MFLSWQQRIEHQPQWANFNAWPSIPVERIPQTKRRTYVRNQRIVKAVLGGQPLKQVAQQLGVSPSLVTKVMQRSLAGDEDTAPPLTSALVPNQHLHEHHRHEALDSLTSARGHACAFKALLSTVPRLKEEMDRLIDEKLADANTAQTLSPQYLHGAFKRLLAEAHWSKDQYPYTTDTLAYESVRRYLKQRLESRRAELGKAEAPIALSVKRLERFRALDVVQIDEHTVDCTGRLNLLLDDDLIPLRLSRVTLLLATDVATDCHLGYFLALSQHPNQQDMLALREHAMRPSALPPLQTPGFEYAVGADFPAHVLGRPLTFGLLQLDNALVHGADSIRHTLLSQGTALHYGPPGQPKVRNWIEVAFAYANRRASHRFASTTGSHIRDPKRESRENHKKAPAITLDSLEEALRIALTEHNTRGQPRFNGANPMEQMIYEHQQQLVRHTPVIELDHWRPFQTIKVVPLHWYHHEHRAPFINFLFTRYAGPGLLDICADETHIEIRYDRRDVRTVEAFSLSGHRLGTLTTNLSWSRFPHSQATRSHIHKLVKKKVLHAADPLVGYFLLKLDRKDNPKDALALAKVYREFSQGGESINLKRLKRKDSVSEAKLRSGHDDFKPWQKPLRP